MAPMRRLLSAAPLAALALASGGCGNDRTPAPDTARPVSPQGSATVSFPQAGVRFAAPGRWDRAPARTPPLVTTVTSGRATVAIWRFPRSEPLPRTDDDMRRARRGLLGAARARDPSFRAGETRATRVGGHRALEVRGSGTVEGQARRLRSLHVFAFGGEVVVDAMAPPADFSRVDREVFRPVLRSLRLTPPQGAP
jgi:hypothetical protein